MCVSTWFLSLFLVKANLDNLFLIVMGIIVFLMQCGFAFLEAGAVRSKNTVNILIKNMLDLLIAGKVYSFFLYLFLMQLNCSLSAKQDLVKWPLFSSDHFYIFLCQQFRKSGQSDPKPMLLILSYFYRCFLLGHGMGNCLWREFQGQFQGQFPEQIYWYH